MKMLCEVIAGFAVIFGWWWLVNAVFGTTESGIGALVFWFGLPVGAVIESFLNGWHKVRRG
jgi:hypothetical protein